MNAVASMPHWMFTMNYKFVRAEKNCEDIFGKEEWRGDFNYNFLRDGNKNI